MRDFYYGNGSRKNAGSSKGRFILIFLVISAVTAAVIWWFLPKNEEKKEPAGKSVVQKEEGAGKKDETISSPAGKKETASEKQEAPAISADGNGREGQNVKKEEQKTEEPRKQSGVTDPADPPLPPKGVITPEDRKGADLPVVPVGGTVSPRQQALLKEAAAFLLQKAYAKAEKSASEALEGVTEGSDFYRQVWRVLTAARTALVYEGKSGPYILRYRIKGGDTLGGIASRNNTTVELLKKKNKISGSRIYVGRMLYIVPGEWKIVVSKETRLLKLFRKDKAGENLFAVWEIGIGRMGKTPAAEFALASRVRHPDWYLPDGRIYKYGEPENQLGDYFLKLASVNTPGRPLQGYGIHGTKDETTVGRSLSNGCVRMRNAEVEVLYYLVPVGSRVVIQEK